MEPEPNHVIPDPATPRSRRALLAATLGGLAGSVATALGRPAETHAAAGSPLILGQTNYAGSSATRLNATSSGGAFWMTQNGSGSGVRGESWNGTGGVFLTHHANRQGLLAQQLGAAGSGAALRAEGGANLALHASADNRVAEFRGTPWGGPAVVIVSDQGDPNSEVNAGQGAALEVSSDTAAAITGYARNTLNGGTFPGVFGRAAGTGTGVEGSNADGTGYGVRGFSQYLDDPGSIGGFFEGWIGVVGIGMGDDGTGGGLGVKGYGGTGVWGGTNTAEFVTGYAIRGYAGNAASYAGYLEGKVGITGHVELSEIADPSAAATDTARLFVRDDGAGKTQLCVRFPTGSVQVIAKER